MKFLFDPIYTAVPNRCASSAKFINLANHLLSTYEDVYIYWRVSDTFSDEDISYLPQHPNIEYVKRKYNTDRYREYKHPREDWFSDMSVHGELWDTDFIITNRSTQVGNIRLNCYAKKATKTRFSKKVVLFEDMPYMTFKESVTKGDDISSDLATLQGYLLSDAVPMCAYWEKKHILSTAKKYLSPASVKEISNKVFESTPVIINETKLKSREFIYGKGTFTIGMSGRMVTSAQFDKIFDIMVKQWVLKNNPERPVECVLSTVSKTNGRVQEIPEQVQVCRYGREKFWDLMINKVHIGVFMAYGEDYSMTLLEPLVLGTPFAVYHSEDSLVSLGEDYPFFVANAKEAYTIINRFYENYPREYCKFAEWSKGYLEPLLQERNKVNHMNVTDKVISDWQSEVEGYYKDRHRSPLEQSILDYVSNLTGVISLPDVLVQMGKDGVLENFGDKFKRRDINDAMSESFATDFNLLRLILLQSGYKDADINHGTFIRKDTK